MIGTSTIGVGLRARLIVSAGILAFALVALVGLGWPGRALSYVYWSQESYGFDGSPIADVLMRSNLDGQGASQMNKQVAWADSLTLAGRTLYFDSSGIGVPPGIGRIAIDGTGLEASGLSDFQINPFLTGSFVGFPWEFDGQLASDSSYIYWIGFQSTDDSAVEVIGRANQDGTNVDPSFITLPNWGAGTQAGTSPATILVSGGYIYWTDPGDGTIGRATVDGSQVTDAFITLPAGAGTPGDLATDGAHLYWINANSGDTPADPGENTIARANLDGTGINLDFITPAGSGALNGPGVKLGEGLAVSGGYIYWGEVFYGNDPTGAIERANLDGTGQIDLTLTRGPVISLAVDGLDGTQVPITTAPAGGETSGGQPHCRVPRLIGVTLAAAKRRLSAAGCALGMVKHRKARTDRRRRVVAQSTRPGRVLKRGSRVGVTIGR